MDPRIRQLKTAIRERLNVEDKDLDIFDTNIKRDSPGPYARKLLSYFIKILYPSRSFRDLSKMIGINYGSVYQSYNEVLSLSRDYKDVKQDLEFISYRIGLKNTYDQRKVKKLLEKAVFKNTNGREIARLLNILTGTELRESPDLNNSEY